MKFRISALFGWFSTLDARKIGVLYLINCALFLVLGVLAALLIQLDMVTPSSQLIQARTFGVMLTGHGMLMVFVMLLPLFPGVFGHLVFPASIGARTLAMRRTSVAGWLCHLIGGLMVTVSLLIGAYDNGWGMMVPASGFSPNYIVLLAGLGLSALAVFLPCLAMVRTTFSAQHRNVRFGQLPLFAWFSLFGALIQLLVTPIRILTIILMIGGQLFGWTSLALSEPEGIWRYQQLFWLYVGPATFGLVLFAVGLIFELLAARTAQPLSSRTLLVGSGVALALFGIASWGKHFIGVADSELLVTVGSMFGLMIIPPSALILLHWSRALIKLRSPYSTPDLYALSAALWLAVTLGIGATLAMPSVGVHLHGTYFTVAHVHIALAGMVFSAVLAGLFHFWPEWWRASYSRRLGNLCALGTIFGVGLSFVPMIVLGTQGLPRALHVYPTSFTLLHTISSIGSFLLAASVIGSLLLLLKSAVRHISPVPVAHDISAGEFSYDGMAVRESEGKIA